MKRNHEARPNTAKASSRFGTIYAGWYASRGHGIASCARIRDVDHERPVSLKLKSSLKVIDPRALPWASMLVWVIARNRPIGFARLKRVPDVDRDRYQSCIDDNPWSGARSQNVRAARKGRHMCGVSKTSDRHGIRIHPIQSMAVTYCIGTRPRRLASSCRLRRMPRKSRQREALWRQCLCVESHWIRMARSGKVRAPGSWLVIFNRASPCQRKNA